jgi:hypothetical protein
MHWPLSSTDWILVLFFALLYANIGFLFVRKGMDIAERLVRVIREPGEYVQYSMLLTWETFFNFPLNGVLAVLRGVPWRGRRLISSKETSALEMDVLSQELPKQVLEVFGTLFWPLKVIWLAVVLVAFLGWQVLRLALWILTFIARIL